MAHLVYPTVKFRVNKHTVNFQSALPFIHNHEHLGKGPHVSEEHILCERYFSFSLYLNEGQFRGNQLGKRETKKYISCIPQEDEKFLCS